MKPALLYLCHRIPYPPNKGDKIAAFNILRYLSQRYQVYLGCFIDDPFDEQFKRDVERYCEQCCFVRLSPTYSKLRGLTSFVTGKPITLPYYYRRAMQQWVDDTIKQQGIEKTFLFSSSMAQYVLPRYQHLHNVMHFVDIDSDKWRQYGEKQRGVMRAIYLREYHRLGQYEREVANMAQISAFVSDAEVSAFKAMLPPMIHPQIKAIENGLDNQYFSPQAKMHLTESYPVTSDNYVVFTGAMDYWANVDAVFWFCDKVWPQVRERYPDAKFYIVGSSPSPKVQALAEQPGVVVTGRVEDIRPYLCAAKVAVAPMQIARGIQNKILEAMAMACPVITSSLGIEGIKGKEQYPTDFVKVSDSANDVLEWVVGFLGQDKQQAQASRQWIEANYSWDAKLATLDEYLGRGND